MIVTNVDGVAGVEPKVRLQHARTRSRRSPSRPATGRSWPRDSVARSPGLDLLHGERVEDRVAGVHQRVAGRPSPGSPSTGSGENPSTTRNGMLAPCTMTTEVICPNRRARRGWARIGERPCPRLVSAKTGVERRSGPARTSAARTGSGTGSTWPAPMEIRKPGNEQPRRTAPRSRIDECPAVLRERRGSERECRRLTQRRAAAARRRVLRPVVAESRHGRQGRDHAGTHMMTRMTR